MKTQRLSSVLIVDDSPDDCYLTSYALSKSGAVEHVWSLHQPQQILDYYADYAGTCVSRPGEFPPAVILLDINMPGMTGFELADALHERVYSKDEVRPAVICMLTSSFHDDDVRRAREHPLVRTYYTKPLSSANIAEIFAAFGDDAP